MLVANFAPTLPEVGYMETFMDWKLIYRTAEEMALLSGEIPGDEWKSSRLFWDEPENIIFLDLVKRDGRPAGDGLQSEGGVRNQFDVPADGSAPTSYGQQSLSPDGSSEAGKCVIAVTWGEYCGSSEIN